MSRDVGLTVLGWGVYQPYGWPLLAASGLVYLAAFAACVLLVRRAADQVEWQRAGLVAGLVGLWPMVAACADSLDLQLSSHHHQPPTHLRALELVGVTTAVVGAVALLAEWRGRRR